MSMTRKHYIDIADAIIEARRTALADEALSNYIDHPVEHTIDTVVAHLVTALKADNQRFDKDTFTDYIKQGVTK